MKTAQLSWSHDETEDLPKADGGETAKRATFWWTTSGVWISATTWLSANCRDRDGAAVAQGNLPKKDTRRCTWSLFRGAGRGLLGVHLIHVVDTKDSSTRVSGFRNRFPRTINRQRPRRRRRRSGPRALNQFPVGDAGIDGKPGERMIVLKIPPPWKAFRGVFARIPRNSPQDHGGP